MKNNMSSVDKQPDAGLVERLTALANCHTPDRQHFLDARDAIQTLTEERDWLISDNEVLLSGGGCCDGCGSVKTIESLRAGGYISCCPERKMLTAKQWSDRALTAETALVEARKALIASQHIERLCTELREALDANGFDPANGDKCRRLLNEIVAIRRQTHAALLQSEAGKLGSSVSQIAPASKSADLGSEPSAAWRPIETAPAYRVPVLLIGPYPTGYGWTDVYHCWRNAGGSSWDRWPHDFRPTHWMPIPSPPAPTASPESRGDALKMNPNPPHQGERDKP